MDNLTHLGHKRWSAWCWILYSLDIYFNVLYAFTFEGVGSGRYVKIKTIFSVFLQWTISTDQIGVMQKMFLLIFSWWWVVNEVGFMPNHNIMVIRLNVILGVEQYLKEQQLIICSHWFCQYIYFLTLFFLVTLGNINFLNMDTSLWLSAFFIWRLCGF